MQIPLDYYRILGVPIQATDELLTQAYHDRFLQLPRREYSQYAIIARKKLLEQAYEALSDSQKRNDYKAKFSSANYQELNIIEIDDSTKQESEEEIEIEPAIRLEKPEENQEEAEKKASFEVYHPYLEISEDLFIGALLILLELGEYELVLKLAQPYVDGQKKLNLSENKTEQLQAIWSDLVLTIASCYIELGREQWQLGEYESAFQSQEKGFQILIQENLFAQLQKEIDGDLHKLRPYLIVEILAKPKGDSSQRNKALNLLKKMLDERQGMESKIVDKSGLNSDDFLRFIQQIRVYLTVKEQQELFEVEAKRPSAAASYLVVYALIARGFSERQPRFIVRAKSILISLTERQDVYLEQAICALLLGQTEEAEFALSQSQEQEAINYIKEHSEGSPDLLPGLCLYGEKWLKTEVFPQFSNLNNQESSLKEYFADEQVQNYLEQLVFSSSDSEIDISTNIKQEFNSTFKQSQIEENLTNDLTDNNNEFNLKQNLSTNVDDLSYFSDSVNHEEINSIISDSEVEISDSNLLTLANEEQQVETNYGENEELVPFDSFLKTKPEIDYDINNSSQEEKINSSLPSDTDSQFKSKLNLTPNVKKQRETQKQSSNNLLGLLIILLLGSIIAIIVYNLVSREEKLNLTISQPLIPIPEKPVINPPKLDNLDKQKAEEIVQSWLNAKKEANGASYKINEFDKILTEPLLSRWRRDSQYLKNNNAYRTYTHNVIVEDVKIVNLSEGVITARVSENSQFYKNKVVDNSKSYNDNLRVEYYVIKKNNKWLIKDTKVIN